MVERVVYSTHYMPDFGIQLRRRREALLVSDRRYSVRQVAQRVGLEPSYLSKIERGLQPPPSEAKIRALAVELDEDPDVLLARAGKIASDVQEVIRRRPKLFARLLRDLRNLPDRAVLRIYRAARSSSARKERP